MPYVDLQSSADALFEKGGRYDFKSHFADALEDEAIELLVDAFERRPIPGSLVAVRTLGGALDRVGPEQSAYRAYRTAALGSASASTRPGKTPPTPAPMVGWARDAWTAFRPFATGGVYVNFAGFGDEADVGLADTIGVGGRFAEVRAAYDPDGLFAAAAAPRSVRKDPEALTVVSALGQIEGILAAPVANL